MASGSFMEKIFEGVFDKEAILPDAGDHLESLYVWHPVRVGEDFRGSEIGRPQEQRP